MILCLFINYGFAPTLWSVLRQICHKFLFTLFCFLCFRDLSDLFRLLIGLLLFLLSFFDCYCSGNNHSRSSLLDFCNRCCCWSSKIVGFINIFCCLFPFMVCQSDGCFCCCCCQCCSFSCFSSVEANFCKATSDNRLQMPLAVFELKLSHCQTIENNRPSDSQR